MTKEERQHYMADYNRHYYSLRSGRETVKEMMKDILLVIPPTRINFNGADQDEPIVCAEFGCSKHLSLTEQLASKFCINHQSQKKIDCI
ncbi:MAG TPA: hypothetical protein PLX17_00550 [Chitinophagaceae bacterium]|nr:hypothetical protein [Chitinophagaceae bacterium]